jgi:predicted ferric reductase
VKPEDSDRDRRSPRTRSRSADAGTVGNSAARSFPGTLLVSKVIYLGLAGATLALAAVGHPHPGRGFLVEFGVGLGFVGFVMLAFQFALTAKFRWLSRLVGLDVLLHFHRQMGFFSYGFILLHVGILISAQPEYAAYLDFRVDVPRALALWTVLLALTAILVTTIWRGDLGLSYEWWRISHAALAALILFIGLVHILRVGWYIADPWKQWIWVGGTAAAVGLLVYTRLVKPLRLRSRRWRVSKVRPEPGRSWTVTLEAVDHRGLTFEAGQFIWLILGRTPPTAIQHPFSISSSAAREDVLEVTIKELGDHTSRIGEVKPGTVAFVEGPYGNFVLDGDVKEAVFVAGGVGITPVMSILRTLRDRGGPISTLLIYGMPSLDEAPFLEELKELETAATPPLTLVPLVESPPRGWTGETGRVTPEMLERHLPADHPGVRYYVCGPEPMMDLVETHLRERGVPLTRIHSERFNIA